MAMVWCLAAKPLAKETLLSYISTPVVLPEFVPLAPRRPVEGAANPRRIWVKREIHDRMVANAQSEDFPSVDLEKLTSAFWAGWYISVSLIGDPDELRPNLERMHTVDEAWVLCFRGHKHNQWRLMGRFIERNCFVGMSLYRRKELDKANYELRALDMIKEWDGFFGPTKTIRGTNVSDYISGVTRDIYADRF